MSQIQIFISAVTDEFEFYRDELARQLTSHNVSVKVQRDFITPSETTLLELDDYIHECAAVIHLVGDATGSSAKEQAVSDLLKRHTDLTAKVPCLRAVLQTAPTSISYTQWEAYLAIYHEKKLILCVPEPAAPRKAGFQPDATQRAQQQAHLQRLASIERHPVTFANSDKLTIGDDMSSWRAGAKALHPPTQ